MKLSETVRQVIDLAARIRKYWEIELPKHHPDYPIVHPTEDSGPPPPEKEQLRELLRGLPEDMVYKLTLIMYLGRGDFSVNNLAENYEAIKRTFGEPKWAADQMMEKAPLADYLSEGLEELRKHRFNIDNLPLKRARSRK